MDPQAWEQRGREAFHQGDMVLAAQAFARAAEGYQAQGDEIKALEAQSNRGIALLMLGEVAKALALLEPLPSRFAAMERPKEEALSWGNLALALERAGRYAQALEAYERCRRGLERHAPNLREERAAVHRGLARLHLRRFSWRTALGHMTRAIFLHPRSGFERVLRAAMLRVFTMGAPNE